MSFKNVLGFMRIELRTGHSDNQEDSHSPYRLVLCSPRAIRRRHLGQTDFQLAFGEAWGKHPAGINARSRFLKRPPVKSSDPAPTTSGTAPRRQHRGNAEIIYQTWEPYSVDAASQP